MTQALRVLCVDDDPLNRLILRKILGPMTACFAEAVDGFSGVEVMSRERFDVVLMDLRMPGMDGLTAIHRIRHGGGLNAKVPFIVLTADVTQEAWQDCAAAGADALLTKPASLRQLCSTIASVLSRTERGVMTSGPPAESARAA